MNLASSRYVVVSSVTDVVVVVGRTDVELNRLFCMGI